MNADQIDDLIPVDFADVLRQMEASRDRTVWVNWIYHPSNLTLECRDECGFFIYEIDLERCRTSAEVLDWIFQVQGKTWATAEIVNNLLEALDDLLNPQGTLCSFGKSSTINPRELLRSRKTR